ncbi:hypothetical protein C8J57DRAFT_1206251 [Mycena rebaudengoi]|nr:hypothetical protein C8J57DRAFT_1206251 [Mycena rebaudengoi]
MEDARGVLCGSYIWGRSVHNTRIERLWYDITHGFGQKWKNFFVDLAVSHGLNPSLPSHIWLLHHLFLPQINEDAQEWAQAWNSHNLQIRGERQRSPRDIFLFSMLQDGPRGVEHAADVVDEPLDDLTMHGIDWDVANNPTLMQHLFAENPQEWEDRNPFAQGPDQFSHVPCDAPDAPFLPEQITYLDQQLALAVDRNSHSMHVRRAVWKEAFRLCHTFYD